MKKEKGKFFVPNQGGLRSSKLEPLWEDIGGEIMEKRGKTAQKPLEDPKHFEESSGRERL